MISLFGCVSGAFSSVMEKMLPKSDKMNANQCNEDMDERANYIF